MRIYSTALWAALVTLVFATSSGSAALKPPPSVEQAEADAVLRSHLDARIQLHLMKLRVAAVERRHLP